MPSLLAPDFHLGHTLFSGQVFRWDREADSGTGGEVCYGLIENIPVRLEQRGAKVFFASQEGAVSRAQVARFLGLDHPVRKMLKSVSRDALMRDAVARHRGLHIVHSPAFECLLSFICSAYSNIPRIRRSLDLIADRRSKPILFEGRRFVPFPRREDLVSMRESTLRTCGLGYRAPYLQKAFAMADEDFLGEVRDLGYEESQKALMRVPGVGEKVADCALLFGFNEFEAFPVDVWVQRVMQAHYFPGKTATPKEVRVFAKSYFGRYAGYAQQYLFHYARTLGSKHLNSGSCISKTG